MSFRRGRLTGAATIAAALIGALLPASGVAAASTGTSNAPASNNTASSNTTAVIVRATAHHVAQARQDVVNAGGHIGIDLPIINGFAATVPATAMAALQHAGGIAAVTPDFATKMQSSTYYPYTDAGSSVGLSYDIGYNQYWNNGYTGKGIGIALIDSGVAPVPSLAASGKVFYAPDFTPTGYFGQQRALDGLGHGTFMAGIIAGRSPYAVYPYINSGPFVGVAPDAHIISVKAGDYTGATTQSAVIAGIQWVIQHKNDSGLNIKVLNLSLGVRDGLSYTNDPLDAAAEAAWRAGITVVASAGNDGQVGLVAPANDPYVIAVGAVDTGSTLSVSDDTVASFSDVGDGHRNPDFATLGTHIVSLRDPASAIDQAYGSGPGSIDSELMRGSGTSEAAAVTSGCVALLLSQRPWLSPDQVKATLKAYAMPLANLTPTNAGAGALNLSWVFPEPTVYSTQTWAQAPSWLMSSSDTSGYASTSPSGAVWKGAAWTSVSWSGSVWTGAVWKGAAWSGAAWTGAVWSGAAWTGSVWKGSVWSGSSWQTVGWQ